MKPSKLHIAVAIGALASMVLLACAQGGCTSSAPSASASHSAVTDAGPSDAAADVAIPPDAPDPCPDPTLSIPTTVPEGWVRAPCAPTTCDVYLSPDAAHMRAPSPWAACGDGCFELVVDWADSWQVSFGHLGASKDGVRYLAYTRDLNGPLEVQIVRLPDNVVVFNAFMPKGFSGACYLYLQALSSESALMELLVGIDDSDPTDRGIIMLGSLSEAPIPTIMLEIETTPGPPLEVVLTRDLWAASFSRKSLLWHDHEPSEPSELMQLGWQSPDGRFLSDMTGADSTVLFTGFKVSGPYELFAWTPDGGTHTLVSFPSVEEGGAGCISTDGIDLVWLEGTGFDAATWTFQEVRFKTSPFASTAAGLKPRDLRVAWQNNLRGGSFAVGGGYVLSRESQTTSTDVTFQLTLTRLSDGAHWVIPPRTDLVWSTPLYVDAEELAIAVGTTPAVLVDAGLQPDKSRTIERRTIASLGPPTLPDAGK